MILTITKHKLGSIAIGGAIGTLKASVVSRSFELTINELESVRVSLVALQAKGIISFTTSSNANDADDALEGTTISAASFSFGLKSRTATQVQVFVASDGNDLTGDGSFPRPYLTLLRALQDYPAALTATNAIFRVSVKPPHIINGYFSLSIPFFKQELNAIVIEAWQDPGLPENSLTDPRFTQLRAPQVSSEAATVASAFAMYAVPLNSVLPADIGKIARIFVDDVEVGRGILADVSPEGALTRLYITNSQGHPVWEPTDGDIIQICTNAVYSDQTISSNSTGQQTLTLLNIGINTLIVNSGVVHVLGCTQGTFADAGIHGVTLRNGASLIGGVNLSPLGYSVEEISLSVSTPSSFSRVVCEGYMNVPGSLIALQLQVQTNGYFMFNHWQGKEIEVRGSGTLDIASDLPCVLGGNRQTPVTQPAIILQGGTIATNYQGIPGLTTSVQYVPAGYAVSSSCITAQRANVSSLLRFMSLQGASGTVGSSTKTVPVAHAISSSEIALVAGTIVGPAGQDIRAGSTFAAFAGIPLVEAATLTRISNT